MSVLDVLPSGVVSVYFMYDVDWKDYGLGKVRARRKRISDHGIQRQDRSAH